MTVAAAAAPLLLLAGAGGCGGLDPDALVRVSGRVVGEDGAPRAGVAVALVRRPGAGEAIPPDRYGDRLAVACLSAAPPPACDGAFRATTAADGRFVLELHGRDTLGLDGTPGALELAAQPDPASPSASVRLGAAEERMSVADLLLWEGGLGLQAAPGALQASVAAAPGGAPVAVAFEDVAGRRVWEAPADGPVDARLLEDVDGLAYPVARPGDATVLRGRPVRYRASAGPPPSRGRACLGGRVIAPCPLTDGDFESPLRLAGAAPSCAAPEGGAGGACPAGGEPDVVRLDLGEARPRSLAVVRGALAPYALELSADGVTWTPAAQGEAGDAALALGGAGARWVRVLAAAGRLSGLRELSLW